MQSPLIILRCIKICYGSFHLLILKIVVRKTTKNHTFNESLNFKYVSHFHHVFNPVRILQLASAKTNNGNTKKQKSGDCPQRRIGIFARTYLADKSNGLCDGRRLFGAGHCVEQR